MDISPSQEKLLRVLDDLDMEYGEIHLECTFSKGRLAKVAVVKREEVVLM